MDGDSGNYSARVMDFSLPLEKASGASLSLPANRKDDASSDHRPQHYKEHKEITLISSSSMNGRKR